jgi:hypothetical protein
MVQNVDAVQGASHVLLVSKVTNSAFSMRAIEGASTECYDFESGGKVGLDDR